jgi:hypothetical protein
MNAREKPRNTEFAEVAEQAEKGGQKRKWKNERSQLNT